MGQKPEIIVIGAGIGGLASALRLAHAGVSVTVLERHDHLGGKIRALDTPAGPADAGPTVLTLRPVFEALFRDVGEDLAQHVEMLPLPVLARHFWRDGTVFDLSADRNKSLSDAGRIFGARGARDLRSFTDTAARLFRAFDAPMMQAAEPSQGQVTAQVLKQPSLIAAMAPHRSLADQLARQFADPRLAQLYGRYATYVGGSPYESPALLGLVSQAEAAGVWHLPQGLGELPRAIAALARARGADIRTGAHVTAISGSAGAFHVACGDQSLRADAILFNGDPRALETGLLGPDPRPAVLPEATSPRSLSACVLAFGARVSGPALSHHNVFFGDTPRAEFDALAQGRLPQDATLYLCAQDRSARPDGGAPERFEIILNAPAGLTLSDQEKQQCQTRIFQRLARFGLSFDPVPGPEALTTPAEFDRLFPGSLGALYGKSPHGMMAAFKRPTARSRVPGLYLAGGGAHPGAGVPMATLSARHAAAAILSDLPSILMSRRTATPGGMSTGSATTGNAPSRLSAS